MQIGEEKLPKSSEGKVVHHSFVIRWQLWRIDFICVDPRSSAVKNALLRNDSG